MSLTIPYIHTTLVEPAPTPCGGRCSRLGPMGCPSPRCRLFDEERTERALDDLGSDAFITDPAYDYDESAGW